MCLEIEHIICFKCVLCWIDAPLFLLLQNKLLVVENRWTSSISYRPLIVLWLRLYWYTISNAYSSQLAECLELKSVSSTNYLMMLSMNVLDLYQLFDDAFHECLGSVSTRFLISLCLILATLPKSSKQKGEAKVPSSRVTLHVVLQL